MAQVVEGHFLFQEIDEELVTGLKAAKSKRMSFAVVLKGGSDGALIVSKQKIPPTAIAEAKKESGGSAVISRRRPPLTQRSLDARRMYCTCLAAASATRRSHAS